MSLAFRPARAAVVLVLLVALAGLPACSHPDPLAPLAGLARSAIGETVSRVDKAHTFLADQVMPHPEVADLYADKAPAEGDQADKANGITWGSTPYIVVGAFDPQGKLLAALPRAGVEMDPLLKAAAQGPAVGDLTAIPNTFAFTLGMRQPVPGHDGAYVSALLDVDKILVQGVLNPVAEAADGFAFLTDDHHNVVLTTLSALSGRSLAHFGIPEPEPGHDATATVTIDGRPYDIGVATARGPHPWVFGVGAAPVAPPASQTPPPAPSTPS